DRARTGDRGEIAHRHPRPGRARHTDELAAADHAAVPAWAGDAEGAGVDPSAAEDRRVRERDVGDEHRAELGQRILTAMPAVGEKTCWAHVDWSRRRHINVPPPGPRSKELHARCTKHFKGLSSQVKLFPVAFESGRGCELVDVDGNRYIDFSSGIYVTTL